MERLIEKMQEGSIYCIGSRPFIDKSQICISIALSFDKNCKKVLYLSHTMNENKFTEKLNNTYPETNSNIRFEEVYKITIDGLNMFASEDNYTLIILDPFDIYSLDLDIGDLKEFAKKKNVAILLTTNLARPPLDSERTHPALSDIQFIDEKAQIKVIAFSEIIMFVYKKENDSKLHISMGKNLYSDLFNEIVFE